MPRNMAPTPGSSTSQRLSSESTRFCPSWRTPPCHQVLGFDSTLPTLPSSRRTYSPSRSPVPATKRLCDEEGSRSGLDRRAHPCRARHVGCAEGKLTWPLLVDAVEQATSIRSPCAPGAGGRPASTHACRSRLGAARDNGPAGTRRLNELCQARFAADALEGRLRDGEFDRLVGVDLRQGDAVLCTRNLWALGLQNGSLGTVIEVDERGAFFMATLARRLSVPWRGSSGMTASAGLSQSTCSKTSNSAMPSLSIRPRVRNGSASLSQSPARVCWTARSCTRPSRARNAKSSLWATKTSPERLLRGHRAPNLVKSCLT